ncbi:hypothetical protein ACPWT1_13085 [Ramlibacter sp. MMS24-I3-19]|uniref:hypothetical protein n=1 Tax=Ramlibacter sp. MMS24-I3-19 TaxID=3416606 RepID=UPI003D06DE76
MSIARSIASVALVGMAVLGAAEAAHAGGHVSVGIGVNLGAPVMAAPVYAQPVYAQPAPVYVQPAPVVMPQSVYTVPPVVYTQPPVVYPAGAVYYGAPVVVRPGYGHWHGHHRHY